MQRLNSTLWSSGLTASLRSFSPHSQLLPISSYMNDAPAPAHHSHASIVLIQEDLAGQS